MKLPRFLKRPVAKDTPVLPSAAMGLRPPALTGSGSVSMHIHVDVGAYVIEGHIFSTDRLVVAFEHAQMGRGQNDFFREGWGARMFRKEQRSYLCIKAKTMDWYQGDGLSETFAELRDSGFLGQFDARMTYGGSMGAFGALVFARQLQADTVLAVSPQTTLNKHKAPWEWRFKEARAQSWTGPNSDAVGQTEAARRVICVYDRRMLNERRHVERLDLSNVIHINTPFMGHGVSHPLNTLDANKPLLSYAYGETDDLMPFWRALRGRRTLPRYYSAIHRKKRIKETPWMLDVLDRAKARHMIDAQS